MRILVTGGTGFVGSNLVYHLVEQGHDVVATGHDAEQKLPKEVKVLQPSFVGLDWDSLGKIDVVFHQAAINDTTLLDEREMFRANFESSKELFKQVVEKGCKRIVYASSTAAYGDAPPPYKEDMPMNPLNPYGKSKKLLDEFAMQFAKEHPDTVIVGLRYCNIYGPRDSHKGSRACMIPQFAKQMLKGNPKLFKFGEQKRDYIYVKDVVKANMLASQAKESCIVNCGSGKATTFNDLIKILNNVLGLNRTPEYIDNPYADKYQSYTECDMSLAKEKIGFVPEFDIEKGIKDYFESGFLIPRE